MSVFDGLISRLLPRKKPADKRPKSMNPTTLRVGIDGDDDGRIVFIIEDGESGDQFAHVSLTPDDASEIADAIYDMVVDIAEDREKALQDSELAATEAFAEHCNALAEADRVAYEDAAAMKALAQGHPAAQGPAIDARSISPAVQDEEEHGPKVMGDDPAGGMPLDRPGKPADGSNG